MKFAALSLLICGAATGTPPQDGRRVQVTPVIRLQLTHSVPLSGSLHPFEETTLIPMVTGVLLDVAVDLGDVVKKDDVLALLAVPDLDAEHLVLAALHEEAHAAIAGAEAEMQVAEAAVVVASAKLAEVSASVDAAEVVRDVALQVALRVRTLHAGRFATDEELDEAEGQLLVGEAVLAKASAMRPAAAAGVEAADAGVLAAVARRDVARTRAATAQARLTAHDVLLGFAQIKCPFESARVVLRHVHPGALVTANETMLLRLVDDSKVRLALAVPEVAVPNVHLGSTVTVRLDAYPGAPFDATISRISGVLDASTRAMACEIDLDNADGRYLPGMYARVAVHATSAESSLVVPGEAVLTNEQNETYVLVAEGGKARKVEVAIGLDDGRTVEVLTGLAAGQLVILGRPVGLRDGDAIEVRESGQ